MKPHHASVVVILPLPDRNELNRYLIPLEVLPSGAKTMAFEALKNTKDFDSFQENMLFALEEGIEELEHESVKLGYYRTLIDDHYALLMEISMRRFYDQFLERAEAILGSDLLHCFKQVISYRTLNAVAAEFTYAPLPTHSGRVAKVPLDHCTALY